MYALSIFNSPVPHRPAVAARFQPRGKGREYEPRPNYLKLERTFFPKANLNQVLIYNFRNRNSQSPSNLHQSNSCALIMTENFVPPGQQRNLRACMVCSIVMTQNVRPGFSISALYLCLLTRLAISQRRMPKLRRIPPPRRQHGRNYRLHITSLRRPNRSGRSE
jgi:hypothetical protein